MGRSTITGNNDIGWVKLDIDKGVKLLKVETTHQKFKLPVIEGQQLTLVGDLKDKLVLNVKPKPEGF